MKMTRHILQALVLAAIGSLGVSTIKAAEVRYTIGGTADLETFNVTYNYGLNQNTYVPGALVGGIQISKASGGTQAGGFPANYTTVCTDVGASVYIGGTYGYDQDTFAGQTGIRPSWGLNAYDGSLNSVPLLQGEQAEAIQNAAQIFYNHFGVLGTANVTAQAALQLAVWAAIYDTDVNGNVAVTLAGSPGSYSLNSARLTVSGADSTAIQQAYNWLQGLNGNYGWTGNLLFPDPNTTQGNGDNLPVQELLIRTGDSAPVPEPTTMIAGALLLLPFGASTLRILRKSRAA